MPFLRYPSAADMLLLPGPAGVVAAVQWQARPITLRGFLTIVLVSGLSWLAVQVAGWLWRGRLGGPLLMRLSRPLGSPSGAVLRWVCLISALPAIAQWQWMGAYAMLTVASAVTLYLWARMRTNPPEARQQGLQVGGLLLAWEDISWTELHVSWVELEWRAGEHGTRRIRFEILPKDRDQLLKVLRSRLVRCPISVVAGR